jgi:hypothetical protein
MPSRISLKFSTLALAVLILGTAFAQPTVPQVRSGGEYWQRSESSWTNWTVVAKELPGRLSQSWPTSLEDPSALLHMDWNVTRWPAVTKFSQGQLLTAVPDEAGGIFIKDIDGASWLRVLRPSSSTEADPSETPVCFVRAHKKFLRPAQ